MYRYSTSEYEIENSDLNLNFEKPLLVDTSKIQFLNQVQALFISALCYREFVKNVSSIHIDSLKNQCLTVEKKNH